MGGKTKYNLEFWADSFHEGDWACNGLAEFFKLKKIEYLQGFIPRYFFEIDHSSELVVTVFGSYKNWEPLPKPIENLLEWGKPDLIIFDPKNGRIMLGVEETAAVPTGNQALQRCERIYGSARVQVPFWYLISEFGIHLDGGVRRDSIWPTALALKLSCIKKVPSIVLHYSDTSNPEDYAAGVGMKELFEALSISIESWFGIKKNAALLPVLERQYQHMLNFIKSQWSNMVDYLPGLNKIEDSSTAGLISRHVLGAQESLQGSLADLLDWGPTRSLPQEIQDNISPGGLIKQDELVANLERIVSAKRAYNLSSNAGSRPQPVSDVSQWISEQKVLFDSKNKTDAAFTLQTKDFPRSATGLLHVTTAKNILYLCDNHADFVNALTATFPRLKKSKKLLERRGPSLVYISNSLKPGRIFGDPFTGQLAAYLNIFAYNLLGKKKRVTVAYYPHQVHTQLFDSEGRLKRNKGTILMRELLDFAVFHGGVVVDLKSLRII